MTSTTTVMESQFAEQFREFIVAESNPGLRKLREQAFAFFEIEGFPAPKSEDWKYTNVAPLAKEEWIAVPFASDFSPAGQKSEQIVRVFDFFRNGFTALNFAFAQFSIVVIPKETSVAEPIEISFAADEDTMISPHVLVIAESGCRATIVEDYRSAGKSFTNAVVRIIVEDNANLTHYRLQRESAEAFHICMTEVSIGRGSLYNTTNINLGGRLSRHGIDAKFTAEGGEAFDGRLGTTVRRPQ